VILDYEELGAFCDQDCGDKRFRSYLCEVSDEGTLGPLQGDLSGKPEKVDYHAWATGQGRHP